MSLSHVSVSVKGPVYQGMLNVNAPCFSSC